jgi:hypothetical protein
MIRRRRLAIADSTAVMLPLIISIHPGLGLIEPSWGAALDLLLGIKLH